ncbi:MAG: Lrp/AsnC family transcriptional regulator [Clostridiales bacterium]|nr:Lrp/AsnC family transcriptional regulator [Clostridiales bacterium]
MINRMELLKLIKNNAKLDPKEIAVMLGSTEEEVNNELSALNKEGIILGYTTQINWEKTEKESVIAMIEVKLSPMRNKGYDHIANLLCKYDKVASCYLVSGDYDLMLIYEDDNLREVASFVSEKVAPLEGVLSTKSHFILKKYKIDGIVSEKTEKDNRQTVIL